MNPLYDIVEGGNGWYFEDLNDPNPYTQLHGPFDDQEQAEYAAMRFLQHE